jgi:hypothetical protein
MFGIEPTYTESHIVGNSHRHRKRKCNRLERKREKESKTKTSNDDKMKQRRCFLVVYLGSRSKSQNKKSYERKKSGKILFGEFPRSFKTQIRRERTGMNQKIQNNKMKAKKHVKYSRGG